MSFRMAHRIAESAPGNRQQGASLPSRIFLLGFHGEMAGKLQSLALEGKSCGWSLVPNCGNRVCALRRGQTSPKEQKSPAPSGFYTDFAAAKPSGRRAVLPSVPMKWASRPKKHSSGRVVSQLSAAASSGTAAAAALTRRVAIAAVHWAVASRFEWDGCGLTASGTDHRRTL